jgi:D-galactarolactone isomerase
MRRLLDNGRTWMKLSSPYTDSMSGPPAYADMAAVARDYLAHAPERMVWASNWPYPDVAPAPAPDPVHLLNLLPSWAPDPFLRHRMLVENPERLYGFDPLKRPRAA